MQDARVQTSRAVSEQAALFREMCEGIPNMGKLHGHSIALSNAASFAEKAFSIIFSINPQVGFVFS